MRKALFAFLLMLVPLTMWAWRRQAAINYATRQWEDAGGGILDSEVPLLGPNEVFVNFDASSEPEKPELLNKAGSILYATCSPSVEFRWKDQNGKLAVANDQDLSILFETLAGTGIKKVVIRRAHFSVERLADFLRKVDSIERFIVPKDCLTHDELVDVNKLVGRDVVHHR